MGRSLATLGVLLTACGLALSCGETTRDSAGSAGGSAGSAGGSAAGVGGSASGSLSGGSPTLSIGGALDGTGVPTCGSPRLYCETASCVGIEECEGDGAARVITCRCVAQLPSSGGAAATAGESGAGGELPASPDPYPGAGCPVDPTSASGNCDSGCEPNTLCAYGAFSLCCVRGGEDCGFIWRSCK